MAGAAPSRLESFSGVALRGGVAGLLALAVLPPFIPLFGPLSLDDCLPLVATVAALFAMLFSREPLRLDGTVVAFVVLAALGVLSSAANAETVGDFLRYCARSTGRYIFYASLVAAATHLLSRKGWARYGLLAFVCAATLEALICLACYAVKYRGPYGIGVIPFPDWSVLHGSFRVQGTFAGTIGEFENSVVSANFLAAYLLMSTIVTATVAIVVVHPWWKNAAVLSTIAQVITLYLTYTRSATLGFGVAILVTGWLLGRRGTALAVLLLGVTLTLAIPNVRAKFLSEGHDRYALWAASVAITADHPIFGTGDGRYEEVLHSDQKYYGTPFGLATTASHNSILLAAAHLGIAGGVAQAALYLLLLVVALRAHGRMTGQRRALAAGIIGAICGYLFQDQFNNLANVPKVATQLWFLYAILLAMAAEQAPEKPPSATVSWAPDAEALLAG